MKFISITVVVLAALISSDLISAQGYKDVLSCYHCVAKEGAEYDNCRTLKNFKALKKINCSPPPKGKRETCVVYAEIPTTRDQETMPKGYGRRCGSYGRAETTKCRKNGNQLECHCDSRHCNTFDILRKNIWVKTVEERRRLEREKYKQPGRRNNSAPARKPPTRPVSNSNSKPNVESEESKESAEDYLFK